MGKTFETLKVGDIIYKIDNVDGMGIVLSKHTVTSPLQLSNSTRTLVNYKTIGLDNMYEEVVMNGKSNKDYCLYIEKEDAIEAYKERAESFIKEAKREVDEHYTQIIRLKHEISHTENNLAYISSL